MALMSGISHAHGGVKTDAVETVSLEQLEIRQASTTLANILDNVDRPDKASSFQLRYSKFLNKVEQFFSSGHNWQISDFEEKLKSLHNIQNYQQFERWILTPKNDLTKLNMMHEKWLAMTSIRRIISENQAVKIGHWLAIFFNYNNFKQARPAVSFKILKAIFVV